jgi:hypothetical protein
LYFKSLRYFRSKRIMANTLKKIQTVTVGSGGAASIDFTSIPQTYTDLKIVLSARTNRTPQVADIVSLSFNGSTSNRSLRDLYGSGSGTFSSNTTSMYASYAPSAGATASIFGNAEIYIPNYTSSNFKSVSVDSVSENNATESYNNLIANLWSNTAAITSITLTPVVGTLFNQYSTATLYGIANVPAAGNAKATGGIITYDDTYVYHTFPWSGTFTPLTSLTADYLVVAGGAGGGSDRGAGGGAGGLRCTIGATGGGGTLESALSLTATAYTVTVGAGGSGGNATRGSSGSNSVFSTITSTGGGGGGSGNSTQTGVTGGSGGGGASTSGTGAAGTANQGYAGGNGFNGTNNGSGAGGGAGAVGGNGTGSNGGTGGAGITTSISGTSTTYAGGGGGGIASPGTGGTASNGGGAGSNTSPATSGTANTGGGGGGSGQGSGTVGGAGGSGIVIVRYAR